MSHAGDALIVRGGYQLNHESHEAGNNQLQVHEEDQKDHLSFFAILPLS
jgi:hypothetical protein